MIQYALLQQRALLCNIIVHILVAFHNRVTNHYKIFYPQCILHHRYSLSEAINNKQLNIICENMSINNYR